MILEQHYLDCLSQASYLIGDESTGRAVVVDPRRDVSDYLKSASEHGLEIELVVETHFHADFLSGHLELAAATGAEIAYGSVADTEFESRKLADGERIELGEVVLEVRHTPGHTPESISVVVYEHADDEEPYGVLTGDALFIGDVGRPDLLSAEGVSAETLAGQLYDSVHEQLMSLPDATRVYPAHGAGSSCGKNLSTDTWSTIGTQRVDNYAVQPMSKESFVQVVTDGQTAPPAYFAYDGALNRADREILDETSPPPPLALGDVLRALGEGAYVLDSRDPNEFAAGHLIGSINIGLSGRYAEYAGGILEPGTPIVLVVEPGVELEAKNRLARIGFDTVIGFLDDPIRALAENPSEVVTSKRYDVAALTQVMAEVGDLQLVDVRQPGETEGGTIPDATEIPLTMLNQLMSTLDPSKPTVVYCAGGYRSSIAASTMLAAGFGDVADLLGGYGAWHTAVAAG